VTQLAIKRVYEPAEPEDGMRVLVDRLWPRGVSRSEAHIDAWLKEVAPTAALRKWFGHDPARWHEFRKRYSAELDANSVELPRLREFARQGKVTLVYSAHDEAHNQALVLLDYLTVTAKT
jgi:uncharacterized protein YeaO (DUF488 family)